MFEQKVCTWFVGLDFDNNLDPFKMIKTINIKINHFNLT